MFKMDIQNQLSRDWFHYLVRKKGHSRCLRSHSLSCPSRVPQLERNDAILKEILFIIAYNFKAYVRKHNHVQFNF